MMEKPDEKGFLSRWSARKAEARGKTGDAAEDPVPPRGTGVEKEEALPLDPAALPSVDELTEESDYTVFLRKGVPDAMRKAALRKLWVTEPSVVNYRPLVEYAWHNNEPGFGPLLPTDNVAQMLEHIFGGSPDPVREEGEAPASVPRDVPAAVQLAVPEAGPDAALDTGKPLTASSGTETPQDAMPRRRHGGALPS